MRRRGLAGRGGDAGRGWSTPRGRLRQRVETSCSGGPGPGAPEVLAVVADLGDPVDRAQAVLEDGQAAGVEHRPARGVGVLRGGASVGLGVGLVPTSLGIGTAWAASASRVAVVTGSSQGIDGGGLEEGRGGGRVGVEGPRRGDEHRAARRCPGARRAGRPTRRRTAGWPAPRSRGCRSDPAERSAGRRRRAAGRPSLLRRCASWVLSSRGRLDWAATWAARRGRTRADRSARSRAAV